jgi:hypothetical protein
LRHILNKATLMCLHAASCPWRRSAPPTYDDFFGLMTRRLAAEGGLIAEAALRERWQRHGHPLRELDGLLGGSRLRSIACGSQRWLPAFQLQADGCTPRADVATVADELDGGMDNAEILAWFACRNASLGGATPLDGLRAGLPPVLEAARLDRFIGSA